MSSKSQERSQDGCVSKFESLSHIAETQPQCYCNFTPGFSPKQNYLMRLIDSSQDEKKTSLTEVENKIRKQFLPNPTGLKSSGDVERPVLELLIRLAGLNIITLETESAQNFRDF